MPDAVEKYQGVEPLAVGLTISPLICRVLLMDSQKYLIPELLSPFP